MRALFTRARAKALRAGSGASGLTSRVNIAWTKQRVRVAAYGLDAAFNVSFAGYRGRRGTVFASDLLLSVGSWRCGYENEQGFAAKMLRPYEAAYAQIRQRQRRSFLNQLEGESR
jgi:hypothetical protein